MSASSTRMSDSIDDDNINSTPVVDDLASSPCSFHCYEFMTLQFLSQCCEGGGGSGGNSKEGVSGAWRTLAQFLAGEMKAKQTLQEMLRDYSSCDGASSNTNNSSSALAKSEAWYLGVFLEDREALGRMARLFKEEGLLDWQQLKSEEDEDHNPPVRTSADVDLLPPLSFSSFSCQESFLPKYLRSSNFVDLILDSIVQYNGKDVGPSLPELFRCSPNVEIISLRNNYLHEIPADIGRLKRLKKLILTNNRLQNRSVPSTLTFCTSLEELYLDNNLLDALPGFLLYMPSLKTVHRHGNHNYFKATFMWYHTDVNERIMEESGTGEAPTVPPPVDSLQTAAVKTILSSRIDFFSADTLPGRLKSHLSDVFPQFNLCGNCARVRRVTQSGFKVFTFKNPYLGNTCVPFLHWACCKECAEAIEVPARLEQIHSAREQDRLYLQCVRETIAHLRPSHRSISSLSESLPPNQNTSHHHHHHSSGPSNFTACVIL